MTISRTRMLAAAAAAAVAVAAVAVGAGVLLHTGQPATAAPTATTTRFVTHDEAGNEAFDDLGAPSPNGPDIGDLLAFTQTLTQDGKEVGLVHVSAVGVDHKRHLSQASGTLVLHDGDIEIAGIVPMTPSFTLIITGGTGRYAGHTGTLDFHLTGNTQTLTVHLRHAS